MTNQALVEIFLNHCAVERGLSKNSVAAYRRDLTKFCDFLDSKALSIRDMAANTISEFVSYLRSSDLGESSIARHVVAIRSLFTFLSKDQGIANVAKEFAPPKIP